MKRKKKNWLFLLALLHDFIYIDNRIAVVSCALALLGAFCLIQTWCGVHVSYWVTLLLAVFISFLINEWGLRRIYPVRYVRVIKLSKFQKCIGKVVVIVLFLSIFTFACISISGARKYIC